MVTDLVRGFGIDAWWWSVFHLCWLYLGYCCSCCCALLDDGSSHRHWKDCAWTKILMHGFEVHSKLNSASYSVLKKTSFYGNGQDILHWNVTEMRIINRIPFHMGLWFSTVLHSGYDLNRSGHTIEGVIDSLLRTVNQKMWVLHAWAWQLLIPEWSGFLLATLLYRAT